MRDELRFAAKCNAMARELYALGMAAYVVWPGEKGAEQVCDRMATQIRTLGRDVLERVAEKGGS